MESPGCCGKIEWIGIEWEPSESWAGPKLRAVAAALICSELTLRAAGRGRKGLGAIHRIPGSQNQSQNQPDHQVQATTQFHAGDKLLHGRQVIIGVKYCLRIPAALRAEQNRHKELELDPAGITGSQTRPGISGVSSMWKQSKTLRNVPSCWMVFH